jgi:hypothetical protein
VTLNISFAASFAKGVIDPSLFTEITNQFTTAGFGDISNLLTKMQRFRIHIMQIVMMV